MVMNVYIGPKDRATAAAVEYAIDYMNTVNQANAEHRVLGLATGSSPVRFYRGLINNIRNGRLDVSQWVAFNLDEYVLDFDGIKKQVLDKATADIMEIDYEEPFDADKVKVPEELQPALRRRFIQTYRMFMNLNLFDNIPCFEAAYVPGGHLIDEKELRAALGASKDDDKAYVRLNGADGAYGIIIPQDSTNETLQYVDEAILLPFLERFDRHGGRATLQVVGIGGKGHLAFSEEAISFFYQNEPICVMLVRMANNTIANAREDGHFGADYAPEYAITQGAAQVAKSDAVIGFAWGERKTKPFSTALFEDVSDLCSASALQETARQEGKIVNWYADPSAAATILERGDLEKVLARRGIECKVHKI